MGPAPVRIVWAFPATFLGVLFLPLALATGGGWQRRRGALEIYGGLVAWLLAHAVPIQGGASALTLGHVILGRDRALLESCREHEHVHVRQYERWGPFFIPLYALASLAVALRGGRPYRDNPFEREAFEYCDSQGAEPPADC